MWIWIGICTRWAKLSSLLGEHSQLIPNRSRMVKDVVFSYVWVWWLSGVYYCSTRWSLWLSIMQQGVILIGHSGDCRPGRTCSIRSYRFLDFRIPESKCDHCLWVKHDFRLKYTKLICDPDATHIFDGLSVFPTHVCHLQLGTTPSPLHPWKPTASVEDLFNLALQWIREDRDLRRIKEKEKGRLRGPRTDVSLTIILMTIWTLIVGL